jgi:hypothetical protein
VCLIYQAIPASEVAFFNNIAVSGGAAPVRGYINELLPDVLEAASSLAASSTASSASTKCRMAIVR